MDPDGQKHLQTPINSTDWSSTVSVRPRHDLATHFARNCNVTRCCLAGYTIQRHSDCIAIAESPMPRIPWNASQITAAKTPVLPNEVRTTYSFVGVRNLQLDAFPDGRRIWRVRYRLYRAGKRMDRAMTLGELKNVPPGRARAMLTDIEQAVNADRDPWFEAQQARLVSHGSFNDLVLEWIEKHSQVYKRSWRQDVDLHRLHIATRALGGKPAANVGRQDIIAALKEIAAKSGGPQANRVQALISAVFSWAVDEGKCDSSPAFRIRRRAKEHPRSPTINDDTLRRMWAAWNELPPDIGDVLRLLLLTGQR